MPIRRPSPLGVARKWRGTKRDSALRRKPGEQMPELRLLGAEILDVAGVRRHFERGACNNLDTVALEATDLLRVVGEESHAVYAEVAQDLRADPVVAQVLAESELEVRLHRVAALVLQRVRADLVRETDAA